VERSKKSIRVRLQNFYRWAVNIFRYEGLSALFWRLICRGFRPFGILGLVTIFERELDQPIQEIKAKMDLAIAPAEKSEIESILKLAEEREAKGQTAKVRNVILNRFQKGSLCFLGKIGTEIVHYNWISFNWDEFLAGRFLRLKENEAFFWTPSPWKNGGGKEFIPPYNITYFIILNRGDIERFIPWWIRIIDPQKKPIIFMAGRPLVLSFILPPAVQQKVGFGGSGGPWPLFWKSKFRIRS